MKTFNIAKDTRYANDLKGIAVTNLREVNSFIEYPEAAVWLILNQKYPRNKSIQMLTAILGYDETETKEFIHQCIQSWKDASLIE